MNGPGKARLLRSHTDSLLAFIAVAVLAAVSLVYAFDCPAASVYLQPNTLSFALSLPVCPRGHLPPPGSFMSMTLSSSPTNPHSRNNGSCAMGFVYGSEPLKGGIDNAQPCCL